MGVYRHFPYSNFHEMNMDELIKIFLDMQEEWNATKEEWATYKEYIDNYFNTLDLSEETYNALIRMIDEGVFNEAVDPTIINATSEWLAEHITQPVGVVIDNSLTVSGACADAKATGDRLIALKSEIVRNKNDIDHINLFKVNQPLDETNQPTNGEEGQVLRTKGNGLTEWAKVGQPSYSQTSAAVAEWLDAHPEAVTTVQDHSLTITKLVNGTLGFITPQMFGAVGDGITDDTEAFKTAVLNITKGIIFYIPRGTYLLTPTANQENILDFNVDCTVIGDWPTIKIDANQYPEWTLFNSDANVNFYNINVVGDALDHDYTTISGTHEFGYAWFISGSGIIHNCSAEYMIGDGIVTKNSTISGTGGEIVISNCKISYCRRNGISILDSDTIKIINSEITKCGDSEELTGTSPKSGIDIEPASGTMRVENIYIDNCVFEGSSSSLICGSENYTEKFLCENSEFTNGVFYLRVTEPTVPTVILDNCKIVRDTLNNTPILIGTPLETTTESNLIIKNSMIIDNTSTTNPNYLCTMINCTLMNLLSRFIRSSYNCLFENCRFLGSGSIRGIETINSVIRDSAISAYSGATLEFLNCYVENMTVATGYAASSANKYIGCVLKNSSDATASATTTGSTSI